MLMTSILGSQTKSKVWKTCKHYDDYFLPKNIYLNAEKFLRIHIDKSYAGHNVRVVLPPVKETGH